jgi:hypothetical protein
MANFEESRFLGLSSRAIVLTLVVTAIVVGLFFMPPALKFLFEDSNKTVKSKSGSTAVAANSQASTQKASLNTDKLQQVSSDISSLGQKPAAKTPSKKVDTSDQGGGFFSGWNFKVKASGAGDTPGVQIPAGLSIEKIGSKDAQNFLRGGVSDIKRFIKREAIPMGVQQDAMMMFASALAELAAGVKGVSNEEIVSRLTGLHLQTLREISAGGGDRGRLLSWLMIPVVSFVDQGTKVFAAKTIRDRFSPRMVLVSAAIREQSPPDYGLGQGAIARAQLELVVRSSDVEMVRIINNGRIVREVKLGRPNQIGERIVRVTGDATGVWSFVALDRFGARPYSKSYAFYPRVQSFLQNPNGDYEIDFQPDSAPNSLDKYFFIGSSGGARRAGDGIISTF